MYDALTFQKSRGGKSSLTCRGGKGAPLNEAMHTYIDIYVQCSL